MSDWDIELTDLPLDVRVDKKAIDKGFHYFWNNNQITGFKRDKNGNYVRDEDGNLIAHRTNKQRQLPRGWFNNAHD